MGHLWVALAACALTFAYMRAPGLFWLVVIALGFLAAIWVTSRLVLDGFMSLRCPVCGMRGLKRIATHSFGFRYFHCSACDTRCKRSLVGLWYDASGKWDAEIFSPAKSADPWGNDPVIAPETETHTTQGVLLGNKRRRHKGDDDDIFAG
jgi:hypothetical protein